MNLAHPMQKFQDWFTQQWVIIRGRQINPNQVPWLMGPFGNISSIEDDFISTLAEKENLIVKRKAKTHGVIPSIQELNLPELELNKLSKDVVGFYENTSIYSLGFALKWNPVFRIFGVLVNKLFSKRIGQLNVPTCDINESEALESEIITLLDPKSDEVKHTIWYRTIKSNGQVIFSGVYGICKLPNGKKCVKAVFPLPQGNATVILAPKVGDNGELILDSSGRGFGDPGFYFLLNDSKGNFWSRKINSFRDRLVVSSTNGKVLAQQTQTLWNIRVLRFNYEIEMKN